jgi:translocon-associated protein subunit alpha
MKIFSNSIGLLILVSLSIFLSVQVSSVKCQDDEDDIDEEDAVINDESSSSNLNDEDLDSQTAAETEADEETDETRVTSAPFVKTHVLFVKPESSDLPAGRLVKLLVAFHNNGSQTFVVDSISGSFRYPQDFSYYIQNFSTFDLGSKVVEAQREATFEYLFTPSETFSSRQFGLTINLRYKSVEGERQYVNAVFNDTVNVVEPDEGLDGETFFLYIFLAALVVLGLVGAQQFFSVFKKKARTTTKSAAYAQKVASSSNSAKTDGVDFEWIPKEHLQSNKSPKQSPRQRKTRVGANSSGNSSGGDE